MSKQYDAGSTWQTQQTLMRRYGMTFAEWDALTGVGSTPLKYITLRYYGNHHSLLYNPRQIGRRINLLRNRNQP